MRMLALALATCGLTLGAAPRAPAALLCAEGRSETR